MKKAKMKCDISCTINSILGSDHTYCECECHNDLPAIPPGRERRKSEVEKMKDKQVSFEDVKILHDFCINAILRGDYDNVSKYVTLSTIVLMCCWFLGHKNNNQLNDIVSEIKKGIKENVQENDKNRGCTCL